MPRVREALQIEGVLDEPVVEQAPFSGVAPTGLLKQGLKSSLHLEGGFGNEHEDRMNSSRSVPDVDRTLPSSGNVVQEVVAARGLVVLVGASDLEGWAVHGKGARRLQALVSHLAGGEPGPKTGGLVVRLEREGGHSIEGEL